MLLKKIGNVITITLPTIEAKKGQCECCRKEDANFKNLNMDRDYYAFKLLGVTDYKKVCDGCLMSMNSVYYNFYNYGWSGRMIGVIDDNYILEDKTRVGDIYDYLVCRQKRKSNLAHEFALCEFITRAIKRIN